jgi:hypothetical protein
VNLAYGHPRFAVRIRRRPLVGSAWADKTLRSGGVRDALRLLPQEFVNALGRVVRFA